MTKIETLLALTARTNLFIARRMMNDAYLDDRLNDADREAHVELLDKWHDVLVKTISSKETDILDSNILG